MAKRGILAVIAVFITWSILDFILHGVLLQSTYQATAELWRPMEEMKMSLMYVVTLLFSVCFVAIYGFLSADKSVVSGIAFGILFGLAVGISMGFGSYSYMPIPLTLAWSWFFGSMVKATIAGAVVGMILKS